MNLERKALDRLGTVILVAEITASCSGVPSPKSLDQSSLMPTPIVSFGQTPSLETPIPSLKPTPSLPVETPVPTPPTSSETPPIPILREPPREIAIRDIDLGRGSEPSVAVDPFNPNLIAVASVNIDPKANVAKDIAGCDRAFVRITTDGGETWRTYTNMTGKARCFGAHARLAWSSGNRLYWTSGVFTKGKGVSVGVSYTDDFGEHWTEKVIPGVAKWVGRYPDMTVDNNTASPNFDVVAAAFNITAGAKGSNIEVAVSPDETKSWKTTTIPLIELKGYPARWAIDSQIKPLSNRDFIVSYAQYDLSHINAKNPVKGPWGSVGALRYYTSVVHYDRITGNLTAEKPIAAISLSRGSGKLIYAPEDQSEIDVDQDTGRVWLTVSDYNKGGRVHVGFTDDNGKNWHWQTIAVDGKSSYKPSLTSIDGKALVTFHAITGGGTASSYYVVASAQYHEVNKIGRYIVEEEDYETIDVTEPEQYSDISWRPLDVKLENGLGLREQSTSDDGKAFIAYSITGKGGKPELHLYVTDDLIPSSDSDNQDH